MRPSTPNIINVTPNPIAIGLLDEIPAINNTTPSTKVVTMPKIRPERTTSTVVFVQPIAIVGEDICLRPLLPKHISLFPFIPPCDRPSAARA